MWKSQTLLMAISISLAIVMLLVLYSQEKLHNSTSFVKFNRTENHLIPVEVRNKIIELGQNSNQSTATLELIQVIRKYCLQPPSPKPYSLEEDSIAWSEYLSYKKVFPSWIFIQSVVEDLFRKKHGGFFVEAGAFDGEFLSNTLPLEKKLNWTGLLVEVHVKKYLRLKEKNRKAWSSPVCLATSPHPEEIVLSTYSSSDDDFIASGSTRIQKVLNFSILQSSWYETFQSGLCLPVKSLLQALNVSHVDFFSLDVERSEIEVLETFPFDEITVDVWAIEHGNRLTAPREKNTSMAEKSIKRKIEDDNFISFMEDKGFYYFDIFCHGLSDYIFIRKESTIFKELKVPRKFWKRKNICVEKVDFNPYSMPDSLRDNRHWPILEFKEPMLISDDIDAA